MVKYFFDSYALIEIAKGNSKYIPYFGSPIVITFLNLIEFTYSILLNYGEEKAQEICKQYSSCVVDIDNETVLEALRFRKEEHKKNLSYADCLGYIYAKRNNLLFLTGDEQFRHLPLVEFVKK